MNRLSHCLWFDGKAEEAANFYVSLLPDSRIDKVTRTPLDDPGGKAGDVITVDFTLAGRRHMALNGGDYCTHSTAFSFVIGCPDQAEIDRLWSTIENAGGTPAACGWITDPFGVTWQIVPDNIGDLLSGDNPEASKRVLAALWDMIKPDKATLEAAHRGEV